MREFPQILILANFLDLHSRAASSGSHEIQYHRRERVARKSDGDECIPVDPIRVLVQSQAEMIMLHVDPRTISFALKRLLWEWLRVDDLGAKPDDHQKKYRVEDSHVPTDLLGTYES